ncbi:MAG: hypothetical protein PHU11_06140 [Dysgonamonadaceae bacterium]|nr:hypothetical protein [Dysgonamonadaceae bacterium]MDD3495451.1 hypothetical protein [Dysgonamonadaceae bacterium]
MHKGKKLKRKLGQVAAVLFIISLPVTIYLLTSTKSVSTINGEVIDFGATADDSGIHSYLLVKLEDNRTVKVEYNPASKRNVGKKVLVHVRTTKLFNIKKYTIVGWD